MHLIHVEDDRLESELVKSTLSHHPASALLLQASTVAEAGKLALSLEGSVAILCDHQLPDGTARDLLDAIEVRSDIRMVVVTGCITPRVAALRHHANVIGVFEKPMGLSELESIVDTALGAFKQPA